MNNDNVMEDLLLSFMEDFEEYAQKREKQLWKEISFPCKFVDVLRRLTKNDLDNIKKNYEFKGMSKLKKDELANELARLIPHRFKEVLYTLDQGQYKLLNKIVENFGVLAIPDMGILNAEGLMKYSLAFPCTNDEQKYLYMPPEIMECFKDNCDNKLESIVARNTEWILLTNGMVYYYGVVPVNYLIERIEKLTKKKVDYNEYLDIIFSAINRYFEIDYYEYGFKNKDINNEEKIIKEHEARSSIHYYPFTKKQLIKVGHPDYVEITPQMHDLFKFISEYYKYSDGIMNEIADKINVLINDDKGPSQILEYLQTYMSFPSIEFVQELNYLIFECIKIVFKTSFKFFTKSDYDMWLIN